MFTGLVETTGRIEQAAASPAGRHLRVATALASELRPGDSIAVSGVCLTVTASDGHRFDADISPATIAATTLGTIGRGALVNLERPVRADARMGGHFVLGHVDATGRINVLRPDGDSYWLEVALPRELDPYVISKGSIAIDGVSLTIASLSADRLTVQIIPFTFAHTALAEAHEGDAVNLEADVLGKYVARLLGRSATEAFSR